MQAPSGKHVTFEIAAAVSADSASVAHEWANFFVEAEQRADGSWHATAFDGNYAPLAETDASAVIFALLAQGLAGPAALPN